MRKFYIMTLACCMVISAKLHAQPSSTANIAREAEYDVKFYFLDLDIEGTNSFITGNVQIKGSVLASQMDTFSVELDNSSFTIDSVTAALNGAPYQVAQAAILQTDVSILLPFTAHAGDIVDTRVFYHGSAQTSSDFPNGPGFFSGSPEFSASPPYQAMTWWPCKQSLTDKADSSWFFITTDASSKAVSNGILSNTTNLGNKNRWEWKEHHPIDFYLVSFVVGNMSDTTQYFHPGGRNDSMIIKYYNGYFPGPDTLVQDILQKYSNLFGLYPFYDEKFGVASVELGGGMENQTCVSLGALGSVVWHETMHQWFGDNVTCGSYKDLALNEGFARWAESLYPELTSNTPNATRISVCNDYESAALQYSDGSIYNYNTDTVGILSLYAYEGEAMNYEKGAMMINSMRFEVNNDSLFFLGLRNYQTLYSGKTAVGTDLRDVMNTTTGIDFTDFFNQWYYGYGYPLFDLRWNQINNQLVVAVTETTSDSVQTPLFKTSLELKVLRLNDGLNADTVIRVFIPQNITQFTIPLGDSVTGFTADPNQWILNGQGTIARDTSLKPAASSIKAPTRVETNWSVYPTPATDYLYITGGITANQPVKAELYNSVGQVVMQRTTYEGQKLKLPDLASGVYILKINNSNSFKVLIAR